jgi:hypothetical protein
MLTIRRAFMTSVMDLTFSRSSEMRGSFTRAAWWLGAESNRRHEDFQSSALPTELPSRMTGSREYGSPEPRRKRKLVVADTLASGAL